MDPTQVIEPPKPSKLPIIFVSLLLLLSLSLSALLYYQNRRLQQQIADFVFTQTTNTPTPNPTTPPDPTTNWQMHTDTYHQYTFNYPPDWEVKSSVTSQSSSTLELVSTYSTLYILVNTASIYDPNASLSEATPQLSNSHFTLEKNEDIIIGFIPYKHTVYSYVDESTLWHFYASSQSSIKIEARVHPIEEDKVYQILSTFQFHNSPTPTSKSISGCVAGGCSSTVCREATSEPIFSTCEWKPEYACYQTATCEKQSNGQCGWTMTPELKGCLSGTI